MPTWVNTQEHAGHAVIVLTDGKIWCNDDQTLLFDPANPKYDAVRPQITTPTLSRLRLEAQQ
jgi:hypothetical protein